MEYRIHKGLTITLGVILVICVLLSLYFIKISFQHPSPSWSPGSTVGLSLIIIGLFLIIWLDAVRTVITIDEHNFSIARLFKTRDVRLKDIDGYRIGEKGSFFIEIKGEGRRLSIPQNLAQRKELIEWISGKYQDLDATEREAETEVLLGDERFGQTQEERESRLQLAKKFDTAATVAGIGLMLWAFIYPNPFDLVMILLLIAPWLAVAGTWYFKGLLKLYKSKKSPYPSMVQLMIFPTIGAMVCVLRVYNIYQFGDKAWSMLAGGTAAAAVICIGACWQAIRTSTKKTVAYICIVALAAIFSYALLIFSNCYYDGYSGDAYNVAITGKRVSHGKSTSYYVSLSPWGKFTNGKEVSVGKDFYQGVQEQDSVSVLLYKGKLGIPWYQIVP